MLEEAIKVHQAQSPCHGQEHLQLDEVAQSPVQSDHEGAQGWVFTTSLDNLLQRFTILTEKYLLFCLKKTFLQLMELAFGDERCRTIVSALFIFGVLRKLANASCLNMSQ